MPTLQLTINGTPRTVDVDPRTPLLWVLRDTLNLTGTKFGCGIAQCGACTVHLDGVPARACATPVADVVGRRVTTIEGLSERRQHPVQQAWLAEQVPQCGYCQPGFVMAAAALLAERPRPTDADIDAALGGHICRCGTYGRIRRAIHRAAAAMPAATPAATPSSAAAPRMSGGDGTVASATSAGTDEDRETAKESGTQEGAA